MSLAYLNESMGLSLNERDFLFGNYIQQRKLTTQEEISVREIYLTARSSQRQTKLAKRSEGHHTHKQRVIFAKVCLPELTKPLNIGLASKFICSSFVEIEVRVCCCGHSNAKQPFHLIILGIFYRESPSHRGKGKNL